MLFATEWTLRELDAPTFEQSMAAWAESEARLEAAAGIERLAWYCRPDATRGMSVAQFTTGDGAMADYLEMVLPLNEFIQIETYPVIGLETAMPAINRVVERLRS